MNLELKIIRDIKTSIEPNDTNPVIIKIIQQGYSKIIYDLNPEMKENDLWIERERNCSKIFTDEINLARTSIAYGILNLASSNSYTKTLYTSTSARGRVSIKQVLCLDSRNQTNPVTTVDNLMPYLVLK